MSEVPLEDLMLQASYQNLLDTFICIEKEINQNNTFNQVKNQTYSINSEHLKEILIQAEFQLECYRCHEKLQQKVQKRLKKAKSLLEKETSDLNLNFQENSENLSRNQENLIKEKSFLEEQCINFEAKLKHLESSSRDLSDFLLNISNQSTVKHNKLSKLEEDLSSSKEKNSEENNSYSNVTILTPKGSKFSLKSLFGKFSRPSSLEFKTSNSK